MHVVYSSTVVDLVVIIALPTSRLMVARNCGLLFVCLQLTPSMYDTGDVNGPAGGARISTRTDERKAYIHI